MNRLPVEDVIPQLLSALENGPAVVLQAPPGAGKTTRVPLSILKNMDEGAILMLEPRRLAAVNAARWMAASLGEDVGGRVGYNIRFDRKVSSSTRIEVMTEGILTRRLQSDPLLEGVRVVIFDEFHERSLHSDLALALCRDVQQGLRDDLKIVVMSATLDGERVSRLLGDAPLVAACGRSFPVEVRYLERDAEGFLPDITAKGVLRALSECEGDILAFLPGGGEIRRCKSLLQEALGDKKPIIATLYGDMPFAAQEEAIMPAARRKVVLATNIAETSLTIEGIGVVVDSGFSRQSRFDPASGLSRLVTARISKASAEQRAGRAGRLGPGVCYRLWSLHAQQGLLPYTPPEICAADLSPLALELARWGVSDPASLSWMDIPPKPAMAEGRRLLMELGALDEKGRLTTLGEEMGALPLQPRLARLLLKGEREGCGALACDMAALLSERDISRSGRLSTGRISSESDVADRLYALADWRRKSWSGFKENAPDPVACRAVERIAVQLRRLLHVRAEWAEADLDPQCAGRLLAVAFPDRLAKQREPGSDRYLLANGRGGKLSPFSALHDQPYLVAVNMDGAEGGEGVIRMASALQEKTVREEFVGRIARRRVVCWDQREGRVVAREEERLGNLVLASRQAAPLFAELQPALIEGIRDTLGIEGLNWTDEARQFRARAIFEREHFPEEDWPDLSDARLAETLADWLAPYLANARTVNDLGRVDILSPLKALFTWKQLKRLEEDAPTHLAVPSGSRIRLDYVGGGAPVLAVKLQEMFGLADTPRIARGTVPVLLHLLSPARRPIQVTKDLASFWNSVYPEVKKELKGRYPRHPWPDDPWSAIPTGRTSKRMGR